MKAFDAVKVPDRRDMGWFKYNVHSLVHRASPVAVKMKQIGDALSSQLSASLIG
jgi:hypothetical protein